MNLLSFPKNSLLGIDVQYSHIHLVQCQKISTDYQLQYLAVRETPTGLFRDGKIEDWEQLRALLHTMLPKVGRNTAVAISLPAHLVRMHKLTLPEGMSHADIEIEIKQSIRRELPGIDYPLAIDYKIIPQIETGDMDVHFIAARQEYLNSYKQCIEALGLKLRVVEIDLYALRQAVCYCLTQAMTTEVNGASLLNAVSNDEKLASAAWQHSAPPLLNAVLHLALPQAIFFVSDHHGMIIHYQIFERDQLIQNKNEMADWIQQIKESIKLISTQGLIICADVFYHALIPSSACSWIAPDVPVIFCFFSPLTKMKLDKSFQRLTSSDLSSNYFVALGLAMRELTAW